MVVERKANRDGTYTHDPPHNLGICSEQDGEQPMEKETTVKCYEHSRLRRSIGRLFEPEQCLDMD